MYTLYENIARLRREKHMTQAEIAKKVGYSGNVMIANIEHGKVDLPYSKIQKFAEALDVSVPELLGLCSKELSDKYNSLSHEGKEYIDEIIMYLEQKNSN